MGNCQAAEAATVVIQHPGNKVDRIYWSVSAKEIMTSNPGHYVALVVNSPTARSANGSPLKQLKLLRPDDTLLIGHVYRLISFEDVLKEFAAKKCVKLGKLLKQSGGLSLGKKTSHGGTEPNRKSENRLSVKMNKQEEPERVVGGNSSRGGSVGSSSTRHHHHHNGWKPALQSIAEVGT